MSVPASSLSPDDDDELWSGLKTNELRWKGRQRFLDSKGYALRPRYHEDWVPSWRGTAKSPMDCEDSIALPARDHLIDATRKSDGTLVYIKRVKTGDKESEIATMLSAEPLRSDPSNHSVPILEVFQDSDDPGISYMVMPFLRLMDSPSFSLVHDLIIFADQILKGLVFLHEHGVAHRDCSRKNLMMDAHEMYPQGFHPVDDNLLPDGKTFARPIPRSEVHIKYYYVDFGISVYIPPNYYPKLALGNLGRDQEVPELSARVPYDPFKLDIFIIGNVFRREFYDKFSNVDFLMPLIEAMVQQDPAHRTSAEEALRLWQGIRKNISGLHQRWRLRPRREHPLEKVILETSSSYQVILHTWRSVFNWGAEIQG